MLVGIVKKNAIMMIDFAIEAERKEGKTARDAILEAAGPVPSDHDDDAGGADGYATDRPRTARARSRGGRWAWRWSADSSSRS